MTQVLDVTILFKDSQMTANAAASLRRTPNLYSESTVGSPLQPVALTSGKPPRSVTPPVQAV